MKKAVSIALFGDVERYGQYLPTFVLAHLNLFPIRENWTLVVHVDETLRDHRWGRFVNEVARDGLLDVVWMKPAPLARAMLWRMEPVWRNFDYVFCRDLDALPTPRDRACCDQFTISGCTVHTVLDNVLHVGIMGGLCGFHVPQIRSYLRCPTVADFHRLIDLNRRGSWQHGEDQNVLNRLLIMPGGPHLLEHRFNGWHSGKAAQQSPKTADFYPMQAWSVPAPDHGMPGILIDQQRWLDAADALASHMGAAGYDIEKARAFWWAHDMANAWRSVWAAEGIAV